MSSGCTKVRRSNTFLSYTDDLRSLTHLGILNLDLDKPSYERTGLQGLPVPSGGRKHVKNRYSRLSGGPCVASFDKHYTGIEIDLRQKSMQPGKNGFERIVWAAKNVLNHSLVWLFHDPEHLPESSSISAHLKWQ